jgi:hypothetical protein
MLENKIFEVGYVEYPRTALYYRSVKINTSDYPELEGKTDKEIMDYIKENAHQMKSNEEYYDSLGEEISDQDIIREKNPYSDSDIWVDVYNDSTDESKDDEEEEEEDEDE